MMFLLREEVVMNRSVPFANWWSLISGYEYHFRNKESLFHAISDQDAKIKSVTVKSDHLVKVEVERNGKRARFEFPTVETNGSEDLFFMREIIRCASRRNKEMAGQLSVAWRKPLEDDKRLEDLIAV